MKLVVAMDSDGHFIAAPYTDRDKVSELIEKIQDGDFIANMQDRYKNIYNNPAPVSTFEWRELIYGIEQRGTLEIIEI